MVKKIIIIAALLIVIMPFLSAAQFGLGGNDYYIDLSNNTYVSGGGGGGTDTNASTACSGVEVLLGNGSCLSSASWLTSVLWSEVVGRPTHLSNFTDNLGDRGYTHLSNFTNDLSALTDTNASTACSGLEVLLGNGSCYDSNNFGGGSDTNETDRFNNLTNTNCATNEYVYGVDSAGIVECRSDGLNGSAGGGGTHYVYFSGDDTSMTTDNLVIGLGHTCSSTNEIDCGVYFPTEFTVSNFSCYQEIFGSGTARFSLMDVENEVVEDLTCITATAGGACYNDTSDTHPAGLYGIHFEEVAISTAGHSQCALEVAYT